MSAEADQSDGGNLGDLTIGMDENEELEEESSDEDISDSEIASSGQPMMAGNQPGMVPN